MNHSPQKGSKTKSIKMTIETKKAIEAHLATLLHFQDHLFEQGHNFWYCDAQDEEKKMPFYYYQKNRVENMATCGTCQELMMNRKKIRGLQKQLGLEQMALHTSFKEAKHVKRVSVTNNSIWNPTVAYMG